MDYTVVKGGVSFVCGEDQVDYLREKGWKAYKMILEDDEGEVHPMNEILAAPSSVGEISSATIEFTDEEESHD